MSKKNRRLLSLMLCLSMAMPTTVPAFAAPVAVVDEVAAVQDLDAYLLENTTVNGASRALPVDRSEVNEHALNGYFSYTFTTKEEVNGRGFDMYFGKHAALRAYITVIAVDASVTDVPGFLQQEGWLDQADENGEILFILKAGENGWGSPEEEAEYLKACLAENIGNTANGTRETFGGGIVTSGSIPVSDGTSCGVFTGHACNYYVGYGDGASVLESWTAENPTYVISQAFLGGESVGADYLAQAGAKTYNGINTGSYYYGFEDDEFHAILDQLKDSGYVESSDFITKADVAVPTLFQGYAEDDASVVYWKNANDVVEAPVAEGVYRQSIDSDAWQTLYANSNAAKWEEGTPYGISQVQVQKDAMNAEQVRDFLATYTRYTTPLAYSNNLAYRLDYYPVTEAARTAAESGKAIASSTFTDFDGKEATVELRALESGRVSAPGCPVEGTVYSYISAFGDYDSDGTLDPRECVVYVPDSAKKYGEEGAPVVVIFPGSTQAASTFMDCSGWWAVANDEGCVLVTFGQFCTNNAARLAYGGTADNANFIRSALVMMDEVVSKEAGVALDMSRVYASGHSAGCNAIQTACHTTEDYYIAAVAATSFPDTTFTAESMPSYLFAGQADISEPLPDTRSRDLVKDPWNKAKDSAIHTWLAGVNMINGITFDFEDGDKAGFLANCSNYNESGRYFTYSFANNQGIDLTRFTRTQAREHNCYPEEFRLAWDFLKNFSLKDGVRYYSESAYTADDAIALELNDEPTSIDAIASLDTDYSQAAQLPVTGYFTKNVQVGDETRTAKLYLSDTVSIRPYYTIVAVPDGVDTTEFLKAEGWFDVIDAQGEALYVLEPGKDGWGTAEEEADYVKAAMSFVSGGKNDQGVAVVTTFGEHYLVGYGKGAAALELWAAANPILVVAQTYINGESAGAEALTAVASAEINGKSSNGDITDVLDATIETVGITEGRIAAKDIAVPTIFAGYTGSEAYWMAANDCVATPVDGVYAQDINSDAYATAYANTVRKAAGETTGLSQVKVTEAGAKAAEIYGYMAQWTRYDTTFSYSNALAPRMNYAAAKVEAQTEAKAGKAEAVLSDGTEIWGQGQVVVPGHGTFEVGVMTFSDQNNDGKNDPREYMLYIPEGFEGKKLPVLFVYPGNTQTDIVFMDSTGWWQVADEKGFAVVMVCETYSSPVAATHVDSIGYYNAMMTVLKEQVDGKKAALDFNRVYASGQSLGSNETQAMALEHPEMFACVASTSGAPFTVPSAIVGQIPAMMITGQMDAGTMAKGFEDVGGLIPWGNHMLAAAGIDATFTAESATSVTKVDGRHEAVYAWENAQGIPMLQWGQCLLRPHNCHPSDMPILWDYMEHFAKTEDGTRCYSASAFAEDDAVVIAENEVKDMQEKVVDVKATVAPNFYGHKVSQVVVTFAEGTNPYLLQNADINVWDRGSANPNFGTLKVVDKKVEGNVVTLTINTDSDKLTDRSRNTYGNLTCTGWYMDLEGNIYCAAAADTKDAFGNEILANKAGKTCQPRNLDLVLTVNNDDVTAGIMSTDTKGNWINNPVWEEIELTGGLELVEQKFVNIGAPAPGYDLVSENGEVPVQVIWPENYDAKRAEAYPVIVYQCGGGVCYWQLQAGENGNIAAAHNLGDNVVYDNMMTEWHRMFPEAIVMSVNIHSTNTEASAAEINAVLRYANENWNAAAGKAVLVGNSQGTILGSDAIRQAPELFAGFVECNGNFGANIQVTQTDGTVANSSFGKWTEEEFANMIANDVSCWMFNGETDGTNAGVAQDTYEVLAKAYAAKGYSDEWIYNHIRVSGLQSWKFKQWGETDHSVTKVVAWQYIANPYTDVYENANMKPGQKYKFTGKEAYNYYDYTMDFDYTVYAESVSEWAKALVGGQYDEEIKVPEAPVKAEQTIVTAANASAITKVYGAKAFNLGAKTNGDGKITYKSSNTKVAKVDKNGKVTIKGTGKAVITITAAETENCAAATLKVTIKVVPKKGAVASAKASKKSIVVKAKKDAQATGYQIQVSSSINFTKKATCTYTGKKVSTTIKNLKAGTYYVRTRSYKTVGSKKYYGAYSAVKVVVVK